MEKLAHSTPTRVLIVDDEDDQRRGLSSLVSSWGFEVATARDGQDALEKLQTFSAHVMVSDLNMPRMDGFQLLETLSAQGRAPVTIVLTAFGSIDNAIRTVHDLGAFWFLEKPIQAAALKVLLERAWQETLGGETEVRPWQWADTWPIARLEIHSELLNLTDKTQTISLRAHPAFDLGGASGKYTLHLRTPDQVIRSSIADENGRMTTPAIRIATAGWAHSGR